MLKYIVLAVLIVAGFFIYQTTNKPQQPTVRLTNEDINNFFTGVASTGQTQSQDTINLYATAWCGYCTKARKILQSSGVRYQEFDIEKDVSANKRHKELGGRGVPLIEANGKVIKGYNEQLLKQLVADKRYQL